MINRIFFLFVFSVCLAVPSRVSAQLLMEQSRVERDVQPKEVIVDKITLHNRSNAGVSVRVYWQDFQYSEPYKGKKDFLPAGSSPYSMADWVTFNPQQLTLPPRSKRDIEYTIQVPQNAAGGHYGVLFFEQGEEKSIDGTGVNIVTRLGALFFLDSVIRDKTVSASPIEMDQKTFRGRIKNEGDVYLFPQGQYYVLNQEGIMSDRGKLDKIYLPPEGEAEYAFELAQVQEGVQTMILTFDLDDGDSITREIDFEQGQNGRIEIRAQRE